MWVGEAALSLRLSFWRCFCRIKAAQARCFTNLASHSFIGRKVVCPNERGTLDATSRKIPRSFNAVVHAVILRGPEKVDAIFSIINADCSIICHSAPCSMIFRLCHSGHGIVTRLRCESRSQMYQHRNQSRHHGRSSSHCLAILYRMN